MADHIPSIVESEQQNLQNCLNILGLTAKLVDDVDTLYGDLLERSKAGDPDFNSEDRHRAVVALLHLLTFCRRQLSIGAVTLFRGNSRDSLVHLRGAIDAAAISWRISKHHTLASIWLSAGRDKESHNLYRKHFDPRALYPEKQHLDYNRSLRTLYDKAYDLSSKVLHASVYGVAPHASVRAVTPDDSEAAGKPVAIELHFCDIKKEELLAPTLVHVLKAHLRILDVLMHGFEECGCPVPSETRASFALIEERIGRHREKWKLGNPQAKGQGGEIPL